VPRSTHVAVLGLVAPQRLPVGEQARVGRALALLRIARDRLLLELEGRAQDGRVAPLAQRLDVVRLDHYAS
jgi:hypothetical protein